MLAYSVFSLRLSEDVPSQSDSVHLISFYLTICMVFSLSAMTWFAVVNKFREKKRLPHWLRWFALDYMRWIVCATSMHKKAVRAAKQPARSTSITAATPVTIQLQPLTQLNSIEHQNNSNAEQSSLSRNAPNKMLLRSSSENLPCTNENLPPSPLWLRTSLSVTEEPRKKKHSFRKSRCLSSSSSSKNQESIYAINIINRFVFFVFLFTVIFINIYTWFIYSRSVRTKFFDNQTSWTCFDEARLEVVNCSETF